MPHAWTQQGTSVDVRRGRSGQARHPCVGSVLFEAAESIGRYQLQIPRLAIRTCGIVEVAIPASLPVIKTGRCGGTRPYRWRSAPRFSPAGRHLDVCARRRRARESKWLVVSGRTGVGYGARRPHSAFAGGDVRARRNRIRIEHGEQRFRLGTYASLIRRLVGPNARALVAKRRSAIRRASTVPAHRR